LTLDQFYAAASFADYEAPRHPYTCLLIAWVCFLSWAAKRGEHLYTIHPASASRSGWEHFPYVLAKLAARLGGHWAALRVIEHATRGLLMIERKWSWALEVTDHLERYAVLTRQIQDQYEIAIAELTEGIRDCLSAGSAPLRSCVAALLWTVGLVPEAYALASKSELVPSRHLLRSLLIDCLTSIDANPFTQYVLLSLKDITDLNIRQYRSLFSVINMRSINCGWTRFTVVLI